MTDLLLALVLAVLGAGPGRLGSPAAPDKLPPCARFAEWMDSRSQTGSFYDGLPETEEAPDPEAAGSEPAVLPFGYPDSVCTVLEGFSEPAGICVAPSGLYVYVYECSTGGITVLRASTLERTGILGSCALPGTGAAPDPGDAPDCGIPPVMAMHPRGGYIYTTGSDCRSVAVLRIEDGIQVASIGLGSCPTGIGFSPSGERAYVTCMYAGRVFVLE